MNATAATHTDAFRALIVNTNLPFSEWTQVVLNSRLCKASLDPITDHAHIIETGTESCRFRRTLEKRKGQTAESNIATARRWRWKKRT